MVTNPTLKSQNYNDRQLLANRLDTIADRVIKRGVLVVEKNSNGFFNIIDYFNKNVLVEDLPTFAVASSLCNSFNAKKTNRKKSFSEIATILEQYHKLNNDCMFFRHTIRVSKDTFKVEVALTRLDITLVKLKGVHQQLSSYL